MMAAQYTEATLEREDWALALKHTLVKTSRLMNQKEFLMGSYAFKKYLLVISLWTEIRKSRLKQFILALDFEGAQQLQNFILMVIH